MAKTDKPTKPSKSTKAGCLALLGAGMYDRDCYIGRYGDIPPDKKEK